MLKRDVGLGKNGFFMPDDRYQRRVVWWELGAFRRGEPFNWKCSCSVRSGASGILYYLP